MPTVAIPGPQPAVEIQALHLTDPVIACAVHAIQMAAYAQEAALLGVSRFPPLEQTLQDLQQSPARFLGAWIAGALVGALGVERTTDTPGVLIASLVVSPEWQRQGVGQALLDAAIEASDGSPMTVCTGAGNEPALRLYRRSGFAERTRRVLGHPGIEVVELHRPAPQAVTTRSIKTAMSNAPDLTFTAVRALMLYCFAEFQSGNATTIRVSADGDSFGISDDGRGHPLDKSLEGRPYLQFIYTHFDYPFGHAHGAPVQLQGIGMSMINALCSELTLTVRKRDETYEAHYRDGRLDSTARRATPQAETGISVSARLQPGWRGIGVDLERLEDWLHAVLQTCPSLKLYFNGRRLQATLGTPRPPASACPTTPG